MCEDQSLAKRIQWLEDIEAIRKLQAIYGHYCDKGWNDKGMYCKEVTALFTEDATWESPIMGIYAKGRDEIAQMFEDMDVGYEFFMHSFSNPIIDVDGDTAKAKWLMFLGSNEGDTITLTYSSYDNDYVRTPEGWLIKAIRLYLAQVLG
jgi:hypothetical protein